VIAAAALVLLLHQDDDVSKWIRALGSDSLEEREEAGQHLEAIDPGDAARLRRELEKVTDPEVRARLESVIRKLDVRAKLRSVLGAKRSVTLSMRGEPLAAAVEKLGRALGERITLAGLDEKAPVTLDLKAATLWQSLDAIAGSAGARYEYGLDGVSLRAGKPPRLPRENFEMFQLAVVQASRLQAWSGGALDEAGLIGLELRHPRAVRPSAPHFAGALKIASVKDAGGVALDLEYRPAWAGTMMMGRQSEFCFVETFFVPKGTAMPLTLAGAVDAPFVLEDEAVEIPIDGNRAVAAHGFEFRLQDYSNTDAALSFSILAKRQGVDDLGALSEDLTGLLQIQTVVVVAGDAGEIRAGYRGGSSTLWNFRHDTKVAAPKAVRFRWNTKLHRVQFDWKLAGVRLPE